MMITNKNVAFISDINQVFYALTNAMMIERQASEIVNINLIFVDIDENTKIDINKTISKNKILNLNLIYINSNEFKLGVSKIKHITNTTNVRLYLSTILKEIDNVLYLDNDVVVDGDICDVFKLLDSNYSYGRPWSNKNGWVRILKIKKMLKGKWYVNAGVLYLNLKFMREHEIESNLINFLQTKKIKFADQDVLNCNIKFEPLPHTWNIARDKWEINKTEIASKSKLKIYHFLSTEKQWDEDIENIKSKKTRGSLTNVELMKMIQPQKKWKEYYNLIKNY